MLNWEGTTFMAGTGICHYKALQKIGLPLTLLPSALLNVSCRGGLGERSEVLKPSGGNEIVIMDFSTPLSLDPIEPGWYHRKFFWHQPMSIEFVTKENVPAIRLSTNDTASMLIRHVEISLEEYPRLSWSWFIEQPIPSELSEVTREGDDHPARLFITFQTLSGEKRSMEIVWGNRLKAGEYKYIGQFPHYVARGGNENTNRWFDEEVNLLEIYRHIWPDQELAKLMEIGLFCDSDDTNTRSVSYFGKVLVGRS